MADIETRLGINVDTSDALANIKALQRQISVLHQEIAKGGAQANAKAFNLQQNLLNTLNASGKFAASIDNIATSTESFTTALEKNKMSIGQYFKYAGGASKSFGRFFKTEMDTVGRVAIERVKDLQTQYVKLGRDANGAMRAVKVRPLMLDMENLGTRTAIAAQKQQLLNQLLKQGSTAMLNWGKNTQWAGRQLMVGFTIPLGVLGTTAGKVFADMEKQAIAFKRVYGDSFTAQKETNAMLRQVQDLATEFTKYGVAVSNTMELAAKAAATGKTGADLIAQTTEATRLAVLGQVEQQQALETTMSVQNAFGTSAKDLAGKINFLNAVENQTVTSIEDLTIAIPKAGPVIKQLGGSVEDLSFFLTAMKEGGINASEGANALKSGLASLINPTGKASKMLEGFGVNIKDIVMKNKGDVKSIVIDFAKALDTLDPLNRAQAIEQLFGKFQFSRLSTLFQNVIKDGSQASRVLDLANRSSLELATIANKELRQLSSSPLYQFQKAIEDFKKELAPVGEEFMKAVTPLINFGTDVLKSFNSLGDGTKQFIVNMTGVIAGLGPVVLMTFGLIGNGFANMIKSFAFIKSVFNKTMSSSKVLGETTQYMTQEQLNSAAVASSLEQVHNKLTQQFTLERESIDLLTQSYERLVLAQGGTPVTRGMAKPGPRKFAYGGAVKGPGTGTSDSIPARLSNGEYVLKADAVKKIGVPTLNQLNTAKFANGGFVGTDKFLNTTPSPTAKFSSKFSTFGAKLAYNFIKSKPKFAVRMFGDDLVRSLFAGNTRYSNLFDTGISRGGMDTPDQRAQLEKLIFGIPEDAPGSMRPIYGHMTTGYLPRKMPGQKFDKWGSGISYGSTLNDFYETISIFGNPKLDRYGDVSLLLKNKLRKNATMIAGDSLGEAKRFGPNKVPAPFLNATKDQLTSAGVLRGLGGRNNQYLEGQLIGGFDLNEVKKIITNNPELIPVIQEALLAAGLKIPVGLPKSSPWDKIKNKLRLVGYANGGVVKGPGTGTSDSIPAMVSDGEFIVNAKRTKQYLPLLNNIAAGKVPGFASPDGGSIVSENAKRFKGMTAATHFLSRGLNFILGGGTPGEKANASDYIQEVQSGGAGTFAPIAVAIAKKLGLSLSDPEVDAAFKEVSTKFGQVAATAVKESGKSLIDDTDIEKTVVPRIQEAAKGIKVAGKDISGAVDELFSEMKSYSMVGLPGGTKQSGAEAGGRAHLRGSYKGLSRASQAAAMRWAPDVFFREQRESSSRPGLIRNWFMRRNKKTGLVDNAEMAHLQNPVPISFGEMQASAGARIQSVVKTLGTSRVTEAIAKETAGEIVDSVQEPIIKEVKNVTKTRSPSKEAGDVGKDIGQGFLDGAKTKVDDAKKAGEQLGQSAVNGIITQSGARRASAPVTTPGQASSTARRIRRSSRPGDLEQRQFQENLLLADYLQQRSEERQGMIQRSRQDPKLYRQRKKALKAKMGGARYRKMGLMNVSGGRVSGGLFGASMLSGMAASMMPGPIGGILGGLSMASGMLSMFGGQIAGILPKLAGFIPGIGFAVAGIATFVTVLDVLTKSTRERIEQEERVAKAMEMTQEKKNSVATFFGVSAYDPKLYNKTKTKTTGVQEAAIKELKQNQDFVNSYASTVEAMKNGTDAQVRRMLSQLALSLAPDFAPDQIEVIVEALKQQANKTDIQLDFAALTISPKNLSGIGSIVAKAASELVANRVVAISSNGIVGPQGPGFSQNTDQTGGIGPTGAAMPQTKTKFGLPTFSREDTAKIKQFTSTVESAYSTLQSYFQKGLITKNQFTEALGGIATELSKISDKNIKMTVLNEFMKNIGFLDDPKLRKGILQMSNLSDQMLAIAAGAVDAGKSLSIVKRMAATTDSKKIEKLRKELEKIANSGYGSASDLAGMTAEEINKKFETESVAGTGPSKQDKLNAALTLISQKEEKINKKYEQRQKALQQMADLQKSITEQQRQQLDIASALSRGDVAAAARAAQDFRAGNAARAMETQQAMLEQAKQNELANVKDPLGRTREQIQAMLDKIAAREARATMAGAGGTAGVDAGAGYKEDGVVLPEGLKWGKDKNGNTVVVPTSKKKGFGAYKAPSPSSMFGPGNIPYATLPQTNWKAPKLSSYGTNFYNAKQAKDFKDISTASQYVININGIQYQSYEDLVKEIKKSLDKKNNSATNGTNGKG